MTVLPRRLLAAALVTAALQVGGGPPAAAAETGGTYANPVVAPVADTFADPAVIRGKDGYWYAFGTSDPLRSGEHRRHLFPILKSPDLVHWSYAGGTFTAATRPAWAAAGAGLWAPDIRYADGRYLLYFTVTDTVLNPGGDSAIGVATAPTPLGPWTDSGAPVVPPRPNGTGGYLWTFDPAMATGDDGTRWLYYGSYEGGLSVVPLSPDGLRTAGSATKVTIEGRYEGAYVVHRDGWYYLFGSASNCCAGPTTGYSVFAGRSRAPTGPFTDRDGVPLLASRAGGTPVLQPNGNTWVGTGHNAVVTDDAGQDWIVYHAIDRAKPYLDEPYGVNRRPMLVDRLDWVDGWPTARAGAGASTGPQRAPVTGGVLADRFDSDTGNWRPATGWSVAPGADPDSGGLLRHDGAAGSTDRIDAVRPLPGAVRVGVDVRLTGESAGIALARGLTATIDRTAGGLVVDVFTGTRHDVRFSPLPKGFRYDRWHVLSAEVSGDRTLVSVGEGALGDPIVAQERRAPAIPPGRFALTARGDAEFDNVTAARAARPVRETEAPPRVGRFDARHSDEFDAPLGGAWRWVRPDPVAMAADGALRWPTQAADLVGTRNDASVLLRDAPRGDYVVETRLRLDLGTDTARDFEQAGLIAYRNDDDFARLCEVTIGPTRQIEFGREIPYAAKLSYGGMALTAPGEVTWLRLAHTVDRATGEHHFRAASSTDGSTWRWGGTWTFGAGDDPGIGLVSHGGATPPATALFDYFRVYR
ncbi:family 43 glycosylhydrolase [Amycolatopsis sp. CA-230715]|uniref:family 43 glycosylhydrolase n=1 Tax=Amycolatopsis sp. CA-230715 TaxID=2745196 RepID=UPI001C00F02D|nr:family 43 glycosylhydrolase [Amycolatopsis sp. CA-230715]QWF84648.1 hypothetical protein HUW46_08099 [Amycolatopsis sp. CA-230715]